MVRGSILGICLACSVLSITANAGILGRVGVRDAAVASYTAAQQVKQTTARFDQLTRIIDEIVQAFRQQGFVEVEFRRSQRPLFSIRLYLPPPDKQEGKQ
jgi:hypothetical protein